MRQVLNTKGNGENLGLRELFDMLIAGGCMTLSKLIELNILNMNIIYVNYTLINKCGLIKEYMGKL